MSSEFWKGVLNIKTQLNNACCLLLISSQLYPNPAFFSLVELHVYSSYCQLKMALCVAKYICETIF